MNRYCFEWIKEWCQENGWTDPFLERRDYWAFPPGGVMPLPIPQDVLLEIKEQKGWSIDERLWCGAAIATTFIASLSSYFWSCPMPLVAAFAVCAVVVAKFEEEL